MGWLGWGEIIVILLLVLIFFGPKRIPEIARLLGKGVREIKKATGPGVEGFLEGLEEDEESKPIPEKLTESPDVADSVEPDFKEEDYAKRSAPDEIPEEDRNDEEKVGETSEEK